MKLNLKYLFSALLLPACIWFTACDTDVETIDQQVVKPEEQNPEQYAAYLAALKAYKSSEHYIVYAALDNAPAVSVSEKAFLRSLPDSLDIVTLENADNMTAYDIEDIPGVQAKGIKILYGINYNVLCTTMDAAAFGSYLGKVAGKVAEYSLDGVTISYDGAMDATAIAAAVSVVEKFSSLSDKLLVIAGNPLFIPKANHDAVAYFVLSTTETLNTFNLRSEIAYATDFAKIAPKKLIIAATPSGKLTDENLVIQPAIAESAKSVITMGPLAGVAVYQISDDYYDVYDNYKQTKQAINLLNPASSK